MHARKPFNADAYDMGRRSKMVSEGVRPGMTSGIRKSSGASGGPLQAKAAKHVSQREPQQVEGEPEAP